MNDDDVSCALDLLARRADHRAVMDRLGAVHRRARRRARVRAAGVATGVTLLVAAAGTLVTLDSGALRGSEPAVVLTLPVPGLRVSVEQVTDPAVATAGLSRYEGTGTRQVVLRVRADGFAPEAEGSSPVAIYVERAGKESSGTPGAPPCEPGAALVPVAFDELVTVVVGGAETQATDEVVVSVTACDPVGAQTRTVTVTVPPGG